MRGVPNNPVMCKDCGNNQGCQKDSLCGRCRMTKNIPIWKKYFWTAEQDARLREEYASNVAYKRDLTAAITRLEKLTGFPRHIIRLRAQQLGISLNTARPWTTTERAFLSDHAGDMKVREISRLLRRSHESVATQMQRLRLSYANTDGYSQTMIGELLGLSPLTVGKFTDRGLFGNLRDKRITDNGLRRFLKEQHPRYDLRRVDQTWFKTFVFEDRKSL